MNLFETKKLINSVSMKLIPFAKVALWKVMPY